MKINKTLQNKLDEGRQYRSFDAKNFEVRAEEDGEKIVVGYATTFNQPYMLFSDGDYTVYEQIDSRAFDGCDMSDVIMQYDHVGRVFARTSNGTLEVTPDSIGLYTRASLGGTELGRQLYEEISGGYTTKMSFAFSVAEDNRDVTENHENGTVTVLRTITKIKKLYVVSAVSIPANDATSISARNYGEGVISVVSQELAAVKERERRKRKLKILLEI